MDTRTREHFEERLLEERREALETLDRMDERARGTLAGDDGDLTNYPLHMADDGTDTMEQEKEFLLASKEGRRVWMIDEALRRLYKDEGEYGRCGECGREISEERLELIPWATNCAEHADSDPNTGLDA